MTVDVVMGTYNGERFLDRVTVGILNAIPTWNLGKMIMVDDRSKDSTRETGEELG